MVRAHFKIYTGIHIRYTRTTNFLCLFFGLRRSGMNSTCWTFDAPTKELKRQRKKKSNNNKTNKQTIRSVYHFVSCFFVVRLWRVSSSRPHSHSHANEKELENWNEFFYTLTLSEWLAASRHTERTHTNQIVLSYGCWSWTRAARSYAPQLDSAFVALSSLWCFICISSPRAWLCTS